jgi:ParB family chromosome partitioning protein
MNTAASVDTRDGLVAKLANPLHSSASNEWYTPANVVEAARAVMGEIDMDPASCGIANQIVRASLYFDEATDGLAQQWAGRVFLNPPGGRGSAAKWWRRLEADWVAGYVDEAVFVGFNIEILRTGQSEVYRSGPAHYPFCIPSKRLKFHGGGGADRPTHANVLVYLPPEEDTERKIALFKEHFAPIGQCVVPRPW